jgi:hypothetical protein
VQTSRGEGSVKKSDISSCTIQSYIEFEDNSSSLEEEIQSSDEGQDEDGTLKDAKLLKI